MLISGTLLWILRFGCAGLALPWQFQHFLLLNWLLCILLVLPPPAKAAAGLRSHGFSLSLAGCLLWGVWSSRFSSDCVYTMRRHWTDCFGFSLTYLLSIHKWLLLEGLFSSFFPNYQSALCLCRCPCLSIPQSQQSKCDAASFWVQRLCSWVVYFSWKLR